MGVAAELREDPTLVPMGSAGLALVGRACELSGRTDHAAEYYTLALELDPCMWSARASLVALGHDAPAAAAALPPRDAESASSRRRPRGVMQGSGDEETLCDGAATAPASDAPAHARPVPGRGDAREPDKRQRTSNVGGKAARTLPCGTHASPRPAPPCRRPGGRGGFRRTGRRPRRQRPWGGTPSVGPGSAPGCDARGGALRRRLRRRPVACGTVRTAASRDSPPGAAPHGLLPTPWAAAAPRFRTAQALDALNALPPPARESPWAERLRMRALHEASRHREAAEAGERARSADPHSLHGVEVMSTSLWHLRDKVGGQRSVARDPRLRPPSLAPRAAPFPAPGRGGAGAACAPGPRGVCGESPTAGDVVRHRQPLLPAARAQDGHQVLPARAWRPRCPRRPVGAGRGRAPRAACSHAPTHVRAPQALHLDGRFAYAYTLCGHEHAYVDDAEQAARSFREALRVDARHYNAWYGLGTLYMRQQKYELAELHFRRALALNPTSSVLLCYLGMVLQEDGRFDEALVVLRRVSGLRAPPPPQSGAQLPLGPRAANSYHATPIPPVAVQAVDTDGRNPQARYQLASLLLETGSPAEALDVLSLVMDRAPSEGSVFLLRARINKSLVRRARLCHGGVPSVTLATHPTPLLTERDAQGQNPESVEDYTAALDLGVDNEEVVRVRFPTVLPALRRNASP